jgi:Holliday junction resolvasome RuvABC ATP-dependent DNA helicase subunit
MFYGQEKIKKELVPLLAEIKSGKNYNVLLVAPSGYGKTTLAYRILSLFSTKDFEVSEPPNFSFNRGVRIHFLDEVHELTNPEYLYKMMDSKRYVVILATNETGLLKEPLVNRCIPLIFEPYDGYDMKKIIYSLLPSLRDEFVNELVRISKFNPRIATILCQRLEYIFNVNGSPQDIVGFKRVLTDILNISEEGFNPLERKYIEFLRTSGGRASLDLIVNATRIDKNTVLRDVEPALVMAGIISIGYGGRRLNVSS